MNLLGFGVTDKEYGQKRPLRKKDGKYSLFSDDDLPLTFVRYDCTEEELLPLLPWDEEDNLKEGFEPGQLLEFGLSVAEDNPKKDVWADIADFWTNHFNGTETEPVVSARPLPPMRSSPTPMMPVATAPEPSAASGGCSHSGDTRKYA